MRKLLITMMICFMTLLCACASQKTQITGTKSDMSGYEGFTDTEHVFYDMTVAGMLEYMDAKESFAVYFGFDNCPWCLDAMPVLNEAAKEYEAEVGYIDTRKNPAWQKNVDIDDYDKLVERIGNYFTYDNDGNRHLYTPAVVFIKDGEVVLYHEGTVESHNARERSMTDEEIEELKEIYREGFEAIK